MKWKTLLAATLAFSIAGGPGCSPAFAGTAARTSAPGAAAALPGAIALPLPSLSIPSSLAEPGALAPQAALGTLGFEPLSAAQLTGGLAAGEPALASALAPGVDPALLPAAVSLDAAGPGLAHPVGRAEAAAPSRARQAAALDSAGEFAAAMGETSQKGTAADAAGLGQAYYDGALGQRRGRGVDAAPPDGGGPAGPGLSAPSPSPLGRTYPRAVMILDSFFPGPAPDAIVASIEKLLDLGVRVVYVTPKPEWGPLSAHADLVSRLRARQTNPLMVVSSNGARISIHTPRRTEASRPFIEDLPGIPADTLAKFAEVNDKVRQDLKIRGEFEVSMEPSEENPFLYWVALPGTKAKPEAIEKAYNRALKAKGLVYTVKLQNIDGVNYLFTQSTALKLNTRRIYQALYALAPELDPEREPINGLKPTETVVLGIPSRAPSFMDTLPRGTFVQGVKDPAELVASLGAILGESGLDKVTVMRSDLREYAEWLERRARYGEAGAARVAPRIPRKRQSGDAAYHQPLAFYRGVIMNALMGRLYHAMRKGQYKDASIDAAVETLDSMWRNPERFGVRVPEELEVSRPTESWRRLQKGYLETARLWLKNYYVRHFPGYPRGIDREVAGQLINLSGDGKASVPLDYVSPHTRRRYVVYALPARAELERDDQGNVLVAHVYRTGKEPYQSEFDESVEVNILGRAMLEGYAKRGDPLAGQNPSLWYVNDEPSPRIKVVFHYNTRDLDHIYTPAELDAFTPQVTALIERREADAIYQAWREKIDDERERAKEALLRRARRSRPRPAAQDGPRTGRPRRTGR